MEIYATRKDAKTAEPVPLLTESRVVIAQMDMKEMIAKVSPWTVMVFSCQFLRDFATMNNVIMANFYYLLTMAR